MSSNLNQEYPIVNKFVSYYLENKKYLRHSDIDLYLNLTITSIHNYDTLLTDEDKAYIENIFIENYKYLNVLNNEKKTNLSKLLELKKGVVNYTLPKATEEDDQKNSILSFNFPKFEIYFVAKLYVNGISIEPEYTTVLTFSPNVQQKISLRYKYKDLTPDSYITVSIYSMQLPEEKYLLGSTAIRLFDENYNVTQGRHAYRILPKIDVNFQKNTFNSNIQKEDYIKEELIDKEIDSLIFKYHQTNAQQRASDESKYNNIINNRNNLGNSTIQNDSDINLSASFLQNTADIESYIYNSEENKLQLKNEYTRNFESKLSILLSKTNNSYLELDFPSFNFPVIFEEGVSSCYKRPYRETNICLNIKTGNVEKLKNWIKDPQIRIGKNRKEILNKDNPISEKFLALSSITFDAFAKDIKPNPYESSRINELLNTPDFLKLNNSDEILFWKYRYELLKQNKRYALTKILNAVKWGDSKSENEFIKNILYHWKDVEICDILYMLSVKFCMNKFYLKGKEVCKGFKAVRDYAAKQLNKVSDEDLNFILLQLVQAVRYEDPQNSELKKLLSDRCSKNIYLATNLYWFLETEADSKGNTELNEVVKDYQLYKDQFIICLQNNEEVSKAIFSQISFKKILYNISDEMSKIPKKTELKKSKFKELIKSDGSSKFGEEIAKQVHSFPLDPNLKIKAINPQGSTVFRSALFPVKYNFTVTDDTKQFNKKDDQSKFEVMFKFGDDLRQDQLILQIINYMDTLLKKVHLDYEFTTYKVMATSKTDGFVEFVPNSKTITDTLKEFPDGIKGFIKKTCEGSDELLTKKINSFINSCAGYCVVTYLLGIGDRHLENLLVENHGKMFHIDFGYILGKDPKPMPPPMKLTSNMIETMGGKNSKGYEDFKNKCVNAFWVLRENARLIVNMFYLMMDSGIPELNNVEALDKLHDKFLQELNKQEAANSLLNKIDDSSSSLYGLVDVAHNMAVAMK